MSGSQRFGILNVNKPAGLTSRQVVDRIVSRVRPAKVGHAGTLDPLATGVLVVCVGKATRLIDVVQQHVKSYRARFLLGLHSDTDDITGHVTESPLGSAGPRAVAAEEVKTLLPSFVGRISQMPPKFSAVHVDGARAYELARAGVEFELAPRPIDVYRIDLTEFAYPEFELAIDCGSGTYIRAIGRDLGAALGTGAVMSTLIRTRVGPYTIDGAVTPEQIVTEDIDRLILPPTTALAAWPKYKASADDIENIRSGRAFGAEAISSARPGANVAVVDSGGNLACLAEVDPDGAKFRARRVFIAD